MAFVRWTVTCRETQKMTFLKNLYKRYGERGLKILTHKWKKCCWGSIIVLSCKDYKRENTIPLRKRKQGGRNSTGLKLYEARALSPALSLISSMALGWPLSTFWSDVSNLQNESDGPDEDFPVFSSSKYQLVLQQLFSIFFFPAQHTRQQLQSPWSLY